MLHEKAEIQVVLKKSAYQELRREIRVVVDAPQIAGIVLDSHAFL